MNIEKFGNDNENTTDSTESSDKYETALSSEIADELSDFEGTLTKAESIVDDETISDSMKERVLSSIDTISDELQAKFLRHFGGTAVMGGVLGLQEYFIQTQQVAIAEGSIIGQGNKVALAGVALWATIKSVQYAADKFKAYGVKRKVKAGTIEGANEAGAYLRQEGQKADIQSHRGELDISAEEQESLSGESTAIHDEAGWKEMSGSERQETWKNAMKRIRTETSQILAS